MIYIYPTDVPLDHGQVETLQQLCQRACIIAEAAGEVVTLCFEDVKVAVYPKSHYLDIKNLILCQLQLKMHATVLKRRTKNE